MLFFPPHKICSDIDTLIVVPDNNTIHCTSAFSELSVKSRVFFSSLLNEWTVFFQLVLTVGLLAVVVYLYTVVAFNFFRKFYNKSEDEDEPDMKCDDMMTVSPSQTVHGNININQSRKLVFVLEAILKDPFCAFCFSWLHID